MAVLSTYDKCLLSYVVLHRAKPLSSLHNSLILRIMISNKQHTLDADAETEGSLYDPTPIADEDLWFLPGLDAESEDVLPRAAPLPHANQRPLVDIGAWQDAEAALSKPLAQLSARLGALDERLRRAPEGWRHRLALIEASALSWLSAERVSVERLSLWQALRLSGAQEDSQALLQAGWALRRLAGGPLPSAESPHDIAAFLNRKVPEDPVETPGQGGEKSDESLSDQLANWCDGMEMAQDLHPICRACFGFHLWGATGLMDRGTGTDLEAAVLAERLAVSGLPGGTRFLPLMGAGGSGLRRSGAPETRLRQFLSGADAATLAALRHLDALEDWQVRAETGLAHKSGQTPHKLVMLLASWPLVSAPMAEAETGASRAAVQRNLNEMTQTGLIREVTGQGRYRVWAAKV